jgi:dimethylaniline monooxygenase (N-oxide forming)
LRTTLLGLDRDKEDFSWCVQLRLDDGTERSERFDKVLVATGPYARPFTPKIPGIERFRGQLMHVQAYKR